MKPHYLLYFLLVIGSMNVMATDKQALHWIGPNAARQGFMLVISELYEQYYGIPMVLETGEQAQGIRQVASRKAEVGSTGRTKLEGASEERLVRLVPVAWDTLVLLTHPDNPVNGISTKQLKQILQGEITNWKTLGGPDAAIHLLMLKDPLSDINVALRQRLWNDSNIELGEAEQVNDRSELYSLLSKDAYALAIDSGVTAQRQPAKILALNGVEPSPETLETGDYPLFRPLYITYVSLNNPRRSDIKKLIKLTYSKPVKQVMRRNGLVPYLEAAKLVSLEKARHSRRALAGGGK